jgi:ADP-heptose:LPS heptosyltransferase
VPWALLGGAKKIAGFSSVPNHGKVRREKFISRLDVSPNYDSSRTEIENCLRLVEDVIDDINPQMQMRFSKELEFRYNENDKRSGNDLLKKKGINENIKFIVSAPYSKREAKNWPEERFVKIFKKIIEKQNAKVILIGGNEEKSRIEELADAVGDNCISLSGETSLGECAVIIEKAMLFLGPDSGPAFIATAMKTPSVILYSAADYYRWRVPESAVPRHEIFHPFPCNPCRYQVCPKEKKCIDSISVDEGWEKCELIFCRADNC